MKSIDRILSRIDGRGYKAYKQLEGASESIGGVELRVERVQGDPFAPPSIVSARIPLTRLLDRAPVCKRARTALEDLFLRVLRDRVKRYSRKRGEGHSGVLQLPRLGPVMVKRGAASLEDGTMRVLIRAGLPSRRRRVLSSEASEMLLNSIPRAVRSTRDWLLGEGFRAVLDWCQLWVDQEALRSKLDGLGLVAFVADGSVLPRRCGSCFEPLEGAVLFRSPPSLRVEVELPFRGVVGGMGVRKGLTVIVGPAFHGKTTLLEALYMGVWNHIPGDGRELVITRRDAVFVESENGRRVTCVDMRGFLRELPGGGDVSCFTTSDASGATSAAAGFQEAVMAGSRLILMDEDMLATNLLHRDVWTERITGKKTIVTITELAGSLREKGISLVVVASGALPLLAEADTIVVMDEYRPVDATSYKSVAAEKASRAGLLHREEYQMPMYRPVRPPRPRRWKLRGRVLVLDREEIQLSQGNTRQLEDPGMLSAAVAAALRGVTPEDITVRSGVPEYSASRPIDSWLVLNRLPVIVSRGGEV